MPFRLPTVSSESKSTTGIFRLDPGPIYLINAETQKLEYFSGEEGIPPYAILSHTWIDGCEVSFQEWRENLSGSTKAKSGYSKIVSCSEKAKEDRYLYVWVDT